MADEKPYVNTDELQADDDISPRPACDDQAVDGSRKKSDDGPCEVPRPATSE